MKNIFQIILLLATFSFSYSQEEGVPVYETWLSEDEFHGAALMHAPRSDDAESVRGSIAGVFDTISQEDFLLYPVSVNKSSVYSFPAFELNGESYGLEQKRFFIVSVIFGNKETYVLYEYSFEELREDRETPDFDIDDTPLPIAKDGIDYVFKNTDGNLSGLQETMRKLIKLKRGVDVEQVVPYNSGQSLRD